MAQQDAEQEKKIHKNRPNGRETPPAPSALALMQKSVALTTFAVSLSAEGIICNRATEIVVSEDKRALMNRILRADHLHAASKDQRQCMRKARTQAAFPSPTSSVSFLQFSSLLPVLRLFDLKLDPFWKKGRRGVFVVSCTYDYFGVGSLDELMSCWCPVRSARNGHP